jgi:putative endonuclease
MATVVEGSLLPPMPGERKSYCVYILGSLSGTLYIGMTGNLHKRVFQHRFHRIEGFTDKYQVERLLYWESFDDVQKAINREKQLKGWRRSKKIALIESLNPHWLDLAREWFPWMTSTGASIGPSSLPGKKPALSTPLTSVILSAAIPFAKRTELRSRRTPKLETPFASPQGVLTRTPVQAAQSL